MTAPRYFPLLSAIVYCLFLSAPAPAQSPVAPSWEKDLTSNKPGPFLSVPTCILDFELGWNKTVKAGTAQVIIKLAGPYWRASAQASSTGLARTLWTYDCTMSSIIDSATLHPRFMQHSESDSAETCRYRVSFQPRRLITESTVQPKDGTATTSTSVCAFAPIEDLLSVILFVRSLPLANGDKITRVIQPWDKPYLTTFEVQDREKLTIDGKTQSCIKLGIQIRKIDRSSLKKMKTATIWISDDAERLPVEMRAEIFVGYMSCHLTGKKILTGTDAQSTVPSVASMLVKPPAP